MDNENGPYQEDSVFYNVADGPHSIFVRDKNGCGTVSRLIERGLKSEDFPNFFTPNGDGINDFWQFKLPPEIDEIDVALIRIYDRYGNLLKQLDPYTKGWDGSFKGRLLPESDYWFHALSFSGQKIKGHFTLKR